MDTTGTTARQTRDLVLRHWALANARDWVGFAALLAEDVVYEVPQTRERVRGRAGYTDFFATWPQPWEARIVKCIADDAGALTVVDFVSNEPTATGLSVFEVRGGLITRITDYWPEPYEPGPRASAHVQRYGEE